MKKLKLILILLCIQPFAIAAEGLSPFADFLYWHASEQAASTWATVIKTTNSNLDLDASNIDFNWNPGVRAGFLYEPKCNFWDTRVYWTYFRTKANSTIADNFQIFLPEFFSGFLSGDVFFGGSIAWQLEMNMVDYNISHNIKFGEAFSIRPSIGLKGGTINQKINSTWNAVIYVSNETVKHNFFGIGPSFGLDCRWCMCKGLSLFGDFAGAVMWGQWSIKDNYGRPAGLVAAKNITTTLNQTSLGTCMVGYCAGFEWKYVGRSQIKLQLGWEMQYWVNQLRLPTFQQLPLHSDLTLQGGTCRLLIEL